MNATIDELLLSREQRGLRFILGFRVVFLAFGIITNFFAPANEWEFLATMALLGFFALTTFSGFFMIRKPALTGVVGVGGALIDLGILASLPVIWFHSVGGDSAVSRAYLLKSSPLLSISFAMLVINSVASRPIYPAIITVGVILYNLGLIYFAALDPRVIFERDYIGHMLGEKVHPDLLVTNLLTFAAVGICLTFFTHVSRKTVFEAVNMEKTSLQVSRYFSPAVYNRITTAEDSFFSSPGRMQQVTVLFSDLRGFTSLSEQMNAEDVIRFLSDYHERMVNIIFKNGGTLDKFIGDAIMATFGTPEPAADDASRALRAALEMRSALATLNQERAARGEPALKQGIGIHCGPAIAGNIGTASRLEYTVIGDTVNVASRVESATKEAGTDLLVTAAVVDQVDPSFRPRFQAAGAFQLKGKSTSLDLYRVS